MNFEKKNKILIELIKYEFFIDSKPICRVFLTRTYMSRIHLCKAPLFFKSQKSYRIS